MRSRNFLTVLVSTIVVAFHSVEAAPDDVQGRLAIIHADHSVLVDDAGKSRPADFLDNLRSAGVLVIGRYFGRCKQGGFARKRVVDGGSSRDSEANAILRPASP